MLFTISTISFLKSSKSFETPIRTNLGMHGSRKFSRGGGGGGGGGGVQIPRRGLTENFNKAKNNYLAIPGGGGGGGSDTLSPPPPGSAHALVLCFIYGYAHNNGKHPFD